MSKTAKAIEQAKREAELEDSPRPYRNHYAGGMHTGACTTPESAAVAAFRHLLMGHASNAQVVSPQGTDVFRMHWTSLGVSVWCPPHAYARPTKVITPVQLAEQEAASKPHPKLRRVA